jgi:dienelactone hydrolase
VSRNLTPSATGRLVDSPAGVFFESTSFGRREAHALPDAFAVSRARAAADAALASGRGPAGFLLEAGVDPSTRLRRRAASALDEYADRLTAHQRARARWIDAFWGDAPADPDERVRVEAARRAAADERVEPSRLFGFLRRELDAPVAFDVPDPAAARARWRDAIDDPAKLYAPGGSRTVRRSASVRGPDTREYRLRFASPGPVDVDATARVYEPEPGSPAAEGVLPTLIFLHGLGGTGDRADYWPEESIARALAPDGYRVVLPDLPWHGRRERPGWFSGEPFLGGVPTAFFRLYAAAAREVATLTAWARTVDSPAVGVGGFSLGASVACHVIGRCEGWPDDCRPDVAFPVSPPGDAADATAGGLLADLLGLEAALDDAGWTDDDVAAFAPLLDPPRSAGLDPERVYPAVGSDDAVAPVAGARRLFDDWGVPPANRTEWATGHVGVLTKVVRRPDYRELVADRLDDAASRRPFRL